MDKFSLAELVKNVKVNLYLYKKDFPHGMDTKGKYLEGIASAFVYTEGCVDIGQPGIIVLLGPMKGEKPISSEMTIHRSKGVVEMVADMVAFVADGGPPPVPLDYVTDQTERLYYVLEDPVKVNQMRKLISELNIGNGRDFQSEPIVFMPACSDDSLIFGRASTAIN